MGFNSNMFNKSVFSGDSYKSAIYNESENRNGYAVLKITPERIRSGKNKEDIGVVGIIQNPLEFSINAEWESLGGVTGLLPIPETGKTAINDMIGGVSKLAGISGFTGLGEVYASRKIYKKSGYLEVGADLKIVNWNDDGQPLKSAIILSYLLLPDAEFGEKKLKEILEKVEPLINKVTENIQDGYTNVVNSTTNLADNYGRKDKVEGTIKGVEAFAKTMGEMINQVAQDPIAKNAYQNTLADLKDYVLLRSAPSTVRLQVGEYFDQDDMVLEDAKFQFSKEVTRSGPLYVDINLKFSSRKIIASIDKLGLLNPQVNNGRVIFVSNKNITTQNNVFNSY